jgi:hypothetical protein
MKSDDSQADNLFSRLFSYTPRIGDKRKRTALEDYYTEALAWCLRSKDFRKDFFQLVRNSSPELNNASFPQDGGDEIEIHTQSGFNSADDEDEEENDLLKNQKRRRFDLVIQSMDFVIVLEDKVKWHFTDNQIEAYQSELKAGERFKNFKTKILVLLSPSGKKPTVSDNSIPIVPIKWSTVQQALAEFSGIGHIHAGEELNLPVIQSVCAQLANFLKEKGLTPMKIPKTNISNWLEGIEVRETLVKILNVAREEYGRQKFKKDAVFDSNDDGSKWLGLYNKNREEYFYFGFKLAGKKGIPDFCMVIQMKFPDEAVLAKRLIELGGQKDSSDLNFEQKIDGSMFDGNAEGIIGWFTDKLSLISNAKNK